MNGMNNLKNAVKTILDQADKDAANKAKKGTIVGDGYSVAIDNKVYACKTCADVNITTGHSYVCVTNEHDTLAYIVGR